jgi:uncharacterized protein (DUF952 family)
VILYHIATTRDWRRAQNEREYTHASLATEGFIHLSTAAQIESVANTFFVGVTDLLLLKLDSERLHHELRFDNAVAPDGSTQPFPHLYGPLNMDAIVQVLRLDRDEDGQFRLADST